MYVMMYGVGYDKNKDFKLSPGIGESTETTTTPLIASSYAAIELITIPNTSLGGISFYIQMYTL